MIAPFLFYQSATPQAPMGVGLFPLYGSLHRLLGQDHIQFTLFPLWLSRERAGVTHRYVLWPFFSWATGSSSETGGAAHGWRFWPLYGEFTIEGEMQERFVLWPFFTHRRLELNTDVPREDLSLFPLYYTKRTPDERSTWWFWPLAFGHVRNTATDYSEWALPWPLIQFGRGEEKSIQRVLPLFARRDRTRTVQLFGTTQTVRTERRAVLWPLYRAGREIGPDWQREWFKLALFLYSDDHRQKEGAPFDQRRIDLWPLFTYNRAADGSVDFQAMAFVEAFLKTEAVRRNYSPLWSLATYRKSAGGATDISLFWRFVTWNREPDGSHRFRFFPLLTTHVTPQAREHSFLLGLIQWRATARENALRLFYLPSIRWTRDTPTQPQQPEPLHETAG